MFSVLTLIVFIAAACGDDTASSDGAAVTAGGSAVGRVTIDGTEVDYVTVVPEGFETGDEAPVLLAFPPGGQGLDLTRSFVEGTYRSEAARRGWVVVSPAAPGGRLFFQGSESVVPALLDWVETWVAPEGGRFHVAGVSNGGLSAFRAATGQPERLASLVVFPGYPASDRDRAALADLTAIPVRMFVGGNDTAWVAPMQDAAGQLAALGGDVVLEVVAGEGHIVGSLSGGVRIFDELDAAR